MQSKHSARLRLLLYPLLIGFAILPTMLHAVEQQKGVILKITDSGKGGNVVPKPLGDDPKRIVAELNAQGVTEVRVQVNNGEPMAAVTEAGAKATDTLAKLGFKGKVILCNKQWHLEKAENQKEWVSAMYQTYKKMDAGGKAIVGGFCFGETTMDEEGWENYSKGVAEAVRKLEREFKAGDGKQVLKGKKFEVGGASFGGSFRKLKPDQHDTIKKSINAVGGTLIYAYKSFHSRKGLPERTEKDYASVASAKKFLLEVAGLENLAKVAGQTEVQYRGDAGDGIGGDENFRAALIEIFNEHPNFLHVGAEMVIDNQEGRKKGCLFEKNGTPQPKVWKSLNTFADAIKKTH